MPLRNRWVRVWFRDTNTMLELEQDQYTRLYEAWSGYLDGGDDSLCTVTCIGGNTATFPLSAIETIMVITPEALASSAQHSTELRMHLEEAEAEVLPSWRREGWHE